MARVEYLVNKRDEYSESRISVQVLSVGWNELKRDFEGAVEFDQSDFFRKFYEERLGLAGSEPFFGTDSRLLHSSEIESTASV